MLLISGGKDSEELANEQILEISKLSDKKSRDELLISTLLSLL